MVKKSGHWWNDRKLPWLTELKNSGNSSLINYYWNKFKYDNNTAEKERFVYFGLFGNDYSNQDRYKRPNFQENNFYDNLIEKWIQIFKNAADIQRKNEQQFISNSDFYMEDLKNDPLMSEYMIKIKSEKDPAKQIVNFFQTALINEEISKMFEDLNEKVIQEAFEKGLRIFKKNFKLPENEEEAKKQTEILYSNVLDNLIEIVSLKKPSSASIMENLKGSQAAIKILKTLGYIREEGRTGKKRIVMRYLTNEAVSQKDFDNFKSSYIGIKEEIFRMLSVNLKGSKNIKVEYSGTESSSKSGTYQKTDIKVILPGDKKKIPNVNVNFSVKSANFANKSDFIIPAKLVGEGSLDSRYQEIYQELEKFGGGKSRKSDLNKLFYIINNELIRTTKNIDIPEILNILAFVSMRYMFNMEDFQEIEKNKNTKNLNFFLIGGKIVPFSIVFELMGERLDKDLKDRSKDIVSAHLKPPSKSITYQYYLAREKENIPSIEDVSARRAAWIWGRDFVEKQGKMSFYLKTNEIFKIFNLKNI